MSKMISADLVCPKCDHKFSIVLFRSIWVENPEYRKLILEDTINRFDCPKCGFNINTDYPFFATNVKRGFALWYEPHHDSQIDKDVEGYKNVMGTNSFYARAPRIKDWNAFKQELLRMEAREANPADSVAISDEMIARMAKFIKSISKKKYQPSNDRGGSLMKFSLGILDAIFGKKVIIEVPISDGTRANVRVTQKWMEKMKQEGRITEPPSVNVRMMNFTAIEDLTWIIGQDITQEDFEKFRDPFTGKIHTMLHYENGEPITSLMPKDFWEYNALLSGIQTGVTEEEAQKIKKDFDERLQGF